MPYYTVYFSYISGDKLKNDHTRLDAKNQDDAKRRVIRGEKPKLIRVNKIKKS